VSDPFVGQTLNGYLITRRRGQGAFSWVYEATHVASGTPVAVKMLKTAAAPAQIQEFENEGELLVALSGASRVVDILDRQTSSLTVTLPGSSTTLPITAYFHVLELADDCLDSLIAKIDQIPWAERLGLYRDAVLGVHQMHRSSVVHRDLKSANCLVFEGDFNSVTVKVNDLGRARDLRKAAMAAAIHYRVGRGDPAYWAPEHLWELGRDENLAHRAADLFGLGSLLYEFMTGQGLTGVALLPKGHLINADRLLPEGQRRLIYAARHNEIRAWVESALAIAESTIPKVIRQQGLQLVRDLCDPHPINRFPKVVGIKRRRIPDDLNWLLRRTDILLKQLKNSETPVHKRRLAR
jgi:serine/threonine protein kinase